MSDTGPLVPSLEKGVYSAFRNKETSFRQGQIGSKIITFTDLQLPLNSCLHICDNYLESPITSVLPNLENPFIKNEAYKLLLDFVVTLPSKDDPLFPITDTVRFRPYSYNTVIRQFYTDNKNIKRFTSRKSALSQTNTLPIITYNLVTTALLTGTFVYYRKFDVLLRTILSNITSIEGKHQYLQIELSKTLYKKIQFQQTFDKINYQTIRIKNDESFYFLIHLINFLSKTAKTSLFSKLTQVQLDQLNIILTAGDKAIIYNMGDLKTIVDSRNDDNFYQMVIRHITTLKLAGHADMDISTLDEKEYDKLVEDVAPPEDTTQVETQVTQDPAHNIAAPIDNINKDSSKILVVPTPPTLKPPVVKPTSTKTTEEPVSGGVSHKPDPITTIVKVETQVSPVVLKPLDPNKLTSVIDHAAQAKILQNTQLSDAQRERALKVAQVYKTLEVDGVSIEELLDQTPEPSITDGHLGFLKDKVPDQSMLNSTAIDLDKHYVEKMMSKDIASIAANMATNGMFLVEVFQKDELTALNRVRNYKFTYEDINGRKHRIVFKLPIISPDGTILINGIESRMIKQQVNLPICKIDTWRVSLSSNYNKTLVERVATKAHNYSSYITKYIAAVYKEKVGLDINYGRLLSDHKLPYDYTSIAARYGRLTFNGYQFIFDYENRFNSLIYSESESTFTDEGIEYSVTDLLKETYKLPTQEFNVDDLKWMLKFTKDYDESDKARVEKADLTAPILVFKDRKGRLNIIDGMHRLAKAAASGVKTLPGKLVPQELLDKNRVNKSATEALVDVVTEIPSLEKKYGIFCGTGTVNASGGPNYLFFGYDNFVRGIDSVTEEILWKRSFTDIFFTNFASQVPVPKQLSEWTELKILDKNFPISFILGFEFGLKKTLDHIKLDYKFYEKDQKFNKDYTTIVVPFLDGNLVFDRYPLEKSYVASGLLKFDTKPYEFSRFDTPDVYYTLLQNNGLPMNYLKGIGDFFRLFIDPITRDVLIKMHEPTDPAGLLLRATQMLVTEDAIPTASMKNHRLRGYERFSAILYNEMARSYATYHNQRGNRKIFSINPEAVFLRIIQDQSLHIVDEINPVENIKDKHAVTYSGTGGRTAQSFVIADRRYPEDGVGILSECTPDSQKVALNAYVSANPVVQNIRGMFDVDGVEKDKLEPSQILSAVSLLMPCATNDDKL